MEFRKTSRAVLAVLIVAGACFSAPASARHDRHVARDILLAPLLLPAAVLAAHRPVVYHDTYYAEPHYRGGRHGHAPRYDSRRHGGYSGHGGHRHGGHRHGGHRRNYR